MTRLFLVLCNIRLFSVSQAAVSGPPAWLPLIRSFPLRDADDPGGSRSLPPRPASPGTSSDLFAPDPPPAPHRQRHEEVSQAFGRTGPASWPGPAVCSERWRRPTLRAEPARSSSGASSTARGTRRPGAGTKARTEPMRRRTSAPLPGRTGSVRLIARHSCRPLSAHPVIRSSYPRDSPIRDERQTGPATTPASLIRTRFPPQPSREDFGRPVQTPSP